MITILQNEYSLSNIFLICFQIILPLLIYMISYSLVPGEYDDWFKSLKFDSPLQFLTHYQGMVFSIITFLLTGMVNLCILSFYYSSSTTGMNKQSGLATLKIDLFNSDLCSNLHFYLFPLTILLCNIGFPIAYYTQTFIPHVIFNVISAVCVLYLMFHYARAIDYSIALLLLPLLTWCILNVFLYATVTIDNKSNEDKNNDGKSNNDDSNNNNNTSNNSDNTENQNNTNTQTSNNDGNLSSSDPSAPLD